jgi:hypothetical protein
MHSGVLIFGRRVLAVSVASAFMLTACGSDDDDDDPPAPPPEPAAVQLSSVSSPQGMASAGDTLVKVALAEGGAPEGVLVRLNGQDVTSAFRQAEGESFLLGLLTGLKEGENLIEAVDAANQDKVRGSMKIENYSKQGPILYAPQEQPFVCQTHEFRIWPGGPTLTEAPNNDPSCAVETRVDWVYHDATQTGSAVWRPYDPANPPAQVETIQKADGTQAPYIVRLETGVINRGIYQIAVVADPATEQNPTPFEPPAAWNKKLFYPFGQSCGGGWYVQGTAMGSVGGSTSSANGSAGDFNVLADLPLSRGFAVANSTLNYLGQNCNHIISAETMMMVKERVIEAYGPVLYTMGWGSSGSTIQQSMVADVYPGLVDGIVTMAGFPDFSSPTSPEGRLFYNYQLNNTKTGTTQNATIANLPNTPYDPTYDNATAAKRAADETLLPWTNGEIAAASGYSTYHSVRQIASFWAGRLDTVLRKPNAGDRDNVMSGPSNSSLFKSVIPDEWKYSPVNAVPDAPIGTTAEIGGPAPVVTPLPPNPTGIRPTAAEHNKNILGIDPATGFARGYFANVGVQYGLNALNSGQITMDQFIDLNRRIGGMDIEGNLTAERSQPDPIGLRNAYRSGMVMYGGGGLASTAILNLDLANNEATGAGDLHLKFFHYMFRARLAAANGHHDNHVMWNGVADVAAFNQDPNANPATPVQAPRPAFTGRRNIAMVSALEAMDEWLTAVAGDRSADAPAVKVVRNKPSGLVDGCFGASTPGAPDDFIAERQTYGGFNSVFRRGNGAESPAGVVEVAPEPSRCNAMFPASSFPRFEAGESITGRILQCQLRPVSAADYAGYAERNPGWTGTTLDQDLARIAEVFPEGVCDYSKPGVEEQPIAGTWLQVTGPEQLKVRQPLQ